MAVERGGKVPLFAALAKGLTVRGYTLFEIAKNAESLARGKQFIYNGHDNGALKPIIDRVFPLESIVEAPGTWNLTGKRQNCGTNLKKETSS